MESTLKRRPVYGGVPENEGWHDDVEDEEEEDEYQETPSTCASCDDVIDTGMEIFVMQLVNSYFDVNSQIQLFVLMDEDGEPEIDPIFFDFTCFEDRADGLSKRVKTGLIKTINEPHSVLHCDYCQSSIRIGEKFFAVELGELQLSDRAPDTFSFSNTENMVWNMCLECSLHLLVHEAGIFSPIEIFRDHNPENCLSQNGECGHCTLAKCWRVGRCECRCHRGK